MIANSFKTHHRDTESTEEAQRKTRKEERGTMKERYFVFSSSFIVPASSFVNSLCPLRVLCVSVVNALFLLINIMAQVASGAVSTRAEVAVVPESIAEEPYAEHEEEDGEGGREL